MTTQREIRAALELRASTAKGKPSRLTGYAAIFDSPSENLGGFIEIVRPGAFKRSLQSNRNDPLALVHHVPHMVLGRRSAGTLRLEEDSRGLAFDIDLPDTQTARDLAVSVERGDITGASFAFRVAKGGDKWDFNSEVAKRELLDVDLLEITVTPSPAYLDTAVAVRALNSLKPRPRLVAVRRFLETV